MCTVAVAARRCRGPRLVLVSLASLIVLISGRVISPRLASPSSLSSPLLSSPSSVSSSSPCPSMVQDTGSMLFRGGGGGEGMLTRRGSRTSTRKPPPAASASASIGLMGGGGEVPEGCDKAEWEEAEHFNTVLNCFSEYLPYIETDIKRREEAYERLSDEHKDLLPVEKSYPGKINLLKKAAIANKAVLDAISGSIPKRRVNVRSAHAKPGATVQPPGDSNKMQNMDKIQGTLHLMARDWSANYKSERNQSYGVMLDELERLKPVTTLNRNKQEVLIPGVGLGRLMLEGVFRGYQCQGNDFSWQVLLAGRYLLNANKQPQQIPIFPWIDDPGNRVSNSDMMECVLIPDIDIKAELKKLEPLARAPPKMSVTAGEWVDIYNRPINKDRFEAVLTSFFLDTAPNPITYIQTIYKTLAPGGVWINFGPLKYHWQPPVGTEPSEYEDPRYGESLELTLDEIIQTAETVGFKVVRAPSLHSCTYASNPSSMNPTRYNAAFFTLRKPGGLISIEEASDIPLPNDDPTAG
mmetsp:Transcript_23108/g.45055  ORF Transcript_23108/g.45055 Transcript_23108/m.45055 type:complete len:523 (-) Transcript_23108:119-1687(-)